MPDLLQESNLSALQALLLIARVVLLNQELKSSKRTIANENFAGSVSSVYKPGIKMDAYGCLCPDGVGAWLTSRVSYAEDGSNYPRREKKVF